MSRIGIIAALPEEVKMLTRKTLLPGEYLVRDQLIICVAGIGADNAKTASQSLHNNGATVLISWGCAGALDPELSAGDFILPSQVCDENNTAIDTSKRWNNQLQTLLSAAKTIHSGLLVQAPSMITSTRQKQSLFKTTTAIAVDMESYSIANYARENDLPFIACRAIADSAQTELPQPVIDAMDQQGRINNRKVLLNTLLRPWAIASLIRLGLHFSKAQATLSSVAERLVQLDYQPTS
ncbi:MAG: phosphorylase [Methylococcales bacterium]